MVPKDSDASMDSSTWRNSNGISYADAKMSEQTGPTSTVHEAYRNQSLDLSSEAEDQIHNLAQVLTTGNPHGERVSTSYGNPINPFEDHNNPELDPFSDKFSAEQWAKGYFHVISSDAERYPQRTAGVSYTGLSVFGFGSDTDYQKDVVNIFLHLAGITKRMFRTKNKIPILTDFDGLIRSGEMCVVLGRPGSGVSTLLKTISGKTHGLSVIDSAKFNYQGIDREQMQSLFRGELIYQAETDVHFPRLTVGQTLMLAARARTPENRMPGVSRHQYAEHLRDVVLAIFGLSHTANTPIGNDFIRGVSGGERKRVSIAEVTLTQASLQCWDNSTRGLDSAAALQFVKTLRLTANMTGVTTAVAVYQASQEIYDASKTFDKVALLYEGRQIFFGPANVAKKYFTDMGYLCLPRQTTADFLTSLTSRSERLVAPGFEDRVPRTPDEFAAVWAVSPQRRQLLEDIKKFQEEYPLSGPHSDNFSKSRRAEQAPLARAKSVYLISVPMQIKICIDRGFQRLWGDKTFTFITLFANLLISLVLGSIFYHLPETTESFFGRGALLFVTVLFNALTSALEVLPLYIQRPVVEKHVSFAFYHSFSESIASMLTELPSKIACCIIFNVPLYFMANLRREVGPFFIYLLFVFTCTIVMSMIFRFVGQVTRTISQAVAPMTTVILALIIYTGFVLPIHMMQGWLRWLNYLNPVGYAFEALMANEFHNREFPCLQFLPLGPTYANATGTERTCSVAGGAPGSSSINGDVYIGATYGYYHSHVWRNWGIMLAFVVFFLTLYLWAAEKISFEESKGEVLIYRRGDTTISEAKAIKDEESQGEERNIETPVTLVNESESSTSPQIQRQTAIFHWKDVCYNINIKGEDRVILDHVSGWVKPGTLTALMGASGAGKTSLLNTLANRNSVGVVKGDILVNGKTRPSSFQRQTGYVQQQDIHLLTSTVREALQFSALLRQPASVPKQEKLDYVEEVIKLLEMEQYSGAVVGVPGEGLNVEQRKRLTIGVELVAKPDLLLFLDEPTSGLDSQTAWSILTLIRKLADNGQAILCTIHQPSAVLFQRFDRLLLLAKGGKTIYFGDIGDNSRKMIDYFEDKGAHACGRDQNPADWMLEVIGAAPGAIASRDWHQAWNDSEEALAVDKHLDDLRTELSPLTSDKSQEDSLSLSYAAPFHFQLYMCTKRALEQSWRDPSYIYAKLGLCSAASLFIGLSFQKQPLSMQGVQNQLFSFFMLLVIQVFMCYQAMPSFITQRDLYEARERPAKTYTWSAFLFGNLIVEIPWNTLAALIIFVCIYYPVGLNENATQTGTGVERGGLMFFYMWTFMMFGTTFTSMVVAGVETAEIGAIIAVILFSMSLIFSGVLVSFQNLPTFWKFMYRVSPFTYLISGLLSTGLANTKVNCAPLELISLDAPAGQTCGQYLADFMSVAGGTLLNPDAIQACKYCAIDNTNALLATFNTFYDERWRNLGFLWVYTIFNAGAAVFLYWLARVPKNRSGGV